MPHSTPLNICLLTRFHSHHKGSSFVTRLVHEAQAQGHAFTIVNPSDITLSFNNQDVPVFHQGKPFPRFDLIHYALRWDDISTWDIIDALRQWNFPIIPPHRIPLGDSITMARLYARAGIRTPRTWVLNDAEQLPIVLPDITYPFMLRARTGQSGRKLIVAHNFPEAQDAAAALSQSGQRFLVQEILSPTATDIRVFVVGTQILAAVERTAPMTFLRPIEHGNLSVRPVPLTPAEEELVLAAMRVYGAPYGAISFLRQPNQSPALLEVVRAPTFEEAEQVTGQNLVAPIITHLATLARKHPRPTASHTS